MLLCLCTLVLCIFIQTLYFCSIIWTSMVLPRTFPRSSLGTNSIPSSHSISSLRAWRDGRRSIWILCSCSLLCGNSPTRWSHLFSRSSRRVCRTVSPGRTRRSWLPRWSVWSWQAAGSPPPCRIPVHKDKVGSFSVCKTFFFISFISHGWQQALWYLHAHLVGLGACPRHLARKRATSKLRIQTHDTECLQLSSPMCCYCTPPTPNTYNYLNI